jgi:multidrug efflux pump subunit AcrA (membrane-fusion protein)
LTEETEAIVLRRQKFAVSTAELILDLGEDTRNQTLNVMLPRNDESYARRLEQSRLKFEQAKTQKEMGETLRKYGLEKKRESRVDSVERHAKLVSDRALMVVKAPTDGIVYYGRCVKGKWSEVNTLSAKLRPFGVVSANTVIMTIVKQRPLHMETSLTEKELPDFNTKLAAVITPGADDKLRLTGKITKIETIPGASGRYAVSLDVDTSDAPDWLVAGMTCDAKVKVYENKEALLIPTNLVQTDEEDETTKYVMLVEAEDEDPVRRDVKLGRSKEKMVEVLRGLGEGDEIVKEEKKDEKEEEKKDESKKDD